MTLRQVHGDKVIRVTQEDKGKGAINYMDSLADADAMVTDVPGVPLMIFTADCLPVFFMEPDAKIIGLAHAGWQGTDQHICRQVVEQMKNMGANNEKIIIGYS